MVNKHLADVALTSARLLRCLFLRIYSPQDANFSTPKVTEVDTSFITVLVTFAQHNVSLELRLLLGKKNLPSNCSKGIAKKIHLRMLVSYKYTISIYGCANFLIIN